MMQRSYGGMSKAHTGFPDQHDNSLELGFSKLLKRENHSINGFATTFLKDQLQML